MDPDQPLAPKFMGSNSSLTITMIEPILSMHYDCFVGLISVREVEESQGVGIAATLG
jgi:hypothetical protein